MGARPNDVAAARQRLTALGALYGPDAGELKATVHKGLVEAQRQADAIQTDQDIDQLLAQLHGIVKVVGRLRGQLGTQGVLHAHT